jgi:prephenate dehydrogenase
MIISIIGLGLIGGSLAIDLKQSGFANKIIGVENNENHLKQARLLNLVDQICSLEESLEQGDIIILATPVNSVKKLLPEILDRIARSNKIITDVGSTKQAIAIEFENHPFRKRYVAAHPMAGTEYSGPRAAGPNLFKNKNLIICDVHKSDVDAAEIIRKMYEAIGMSIIYMESDKHDLQLAYISHLSHLISFALSITVAGKMNAEANILKLAGGGFESTARLAKSSADTWIPVFNQNTSNIILAMDDYTKYLLRFKKAIKNKNQSQLKELIINANKIMANLNN